MAERTWFFASEGKQQGPVPEAQLRELIASGVVTADTQVWSDGMSGWQRAAEIPGLIAGAGGPPAIPGVISGSGGGGALTTDLGIWALLGRGLLYVIGMLLVIPAPWVAASFYGWFIRSIRVPQRPGIGFTGKPGDIWYVFVIMGLCTYVGLTGMPFIQLLVIPLQGFLSWMAVRWVVANISSDGRQLPLTFNGSPWVFVGWQVLLYVSFITIIGWAWVTTAWLRWTCSNIAGGRREIVFNGSGWGVLWRTVLFILAICLIIPIPWVLGWYARWYVSQFALVPRAA